MRAGSPLDTPRDAAGRLHSASRHVRFPGPADPALNDVHFGRDDRHYPPGHIQMVGAFDGVQVHGEGLLSRKRILYKDDEVRLDLTDASVEGVARTEHKLRDLRLGNDTPTGGTAHQAGRLRLCNNSINPVPDVDCADASFFPSIRAVNPTLTIIANALRVADVIAARLQQNVKDPGSSIGHRVRRLDGGVWH